MKNKKYKARRKVLKDESLLHHLFFTNRFSLIAFGLGAFIIIFFYFNSEMTLPTFLYLCMLIALIHTIAILISYFLILAFQEYERNALYVCRYCGTYYRKYQLDIYSDYKCSRKDCTKLGIMLTRIDSEKEEEWTKTFKGIERKPFLECVMTVIRYEFIMKRKIQKIENNMDRLIKMHNFVTYTKARRTFLLPNDYKANDSTIGFQITEKLEKVVHQVPIYGTQRVIKLLRRARKLSKNK